ncbi:hypothetical protein LB505_006918 [Fusarium chuoi]|nr:hypothetical protein LB505_006918 [Fusarium chuoi]
MGATFSQFWAPPPITVGLIGLRSAGKTTIVHKLSGNPDPVTPSVESESPFVSDRSHKTDINMDALQEAKTELIGLLKEDMLEQQPFLVLANKQDDSKAMSVAELTKYLNIQQYIGKPSKCVSTSLTLHFQVDANA